MRKLFLIITLLITSAVFSQTTKMSIDENSQISGDSLTVALNIKDFTGVASLTIHINFDTEVLEWGQILNLNSQFYGLLAGSVEGKVILAWYNLEPQTVTEAKLLDLQFLYKGGSGSISFDLVNSQVTDMNNAVPVEFVNGTVGEISLPEAVTLLLPVTEAELMGPNVEFIWNKEASADSYNFQLSSSEDFSNMVFENSLVYDTSIIVEDLIDGKIYFWRISATNAKGSGDYSTVNTFSVPLKAPSELIVQEINSLAELNWTDNSFGESGFYILRKENSSSDFIIIDSTATDITSFTDSSVQYNGTYQYAVKAYNNLFVSEMSNTEELTIVTDLEETSIPSEFELNQNYPNPFNPETKISYSVASFSHVKISVFDTLGKEVAKLVDENKSPGNYNVVFSGAQISSGTYLIKMETEGFNKTVKAILLK